jgi:predicted metal-dependent hydrolase
MFRVIVEFFGARLKITKKTTKKNNLKYSVGAKKSQKKYVDLQNYSILGQNYQITFDENQVSRMAILHSSKSIKLPFRTPILKFHNLLKKDAAEYFQSRIDFWADIMEVKYNKLSVRLTRSKWGSCSRLGNISLNLLLYSMEPEMIDYVIIHELGHTVYFDHSASFWAMVGRYCPDYKLRAYKIKVQSLELLKLYYHLKQR